MVSAQEGASRVLVIVVITLRDLIGETVGSETRRPGFGSKSCHLLTPRPSTSYLTSVSPSVHGDK